MKTETTTLKWLDRHQSHFTAMADEIWANPEIRFEEFKASKLFLIFIPNMPIMPARAAIWACKVCAFAFTAGLPTPPSCPI
jgi:metal-dependent amidase/aminoacylase/carboxypeptidase family protein